MTTSPAAGVQFANRTVLVTGAASGIGAATADLFAAAGHGLLVGPRRVGLSRACVAR